MADQVQVSGHFLEIAFQEDNYLTHTRVAGNLLELLKEDILENPEEITIQFQYLPDYLSGQAFSQVLTYEPSSNWPSFRQSNTEGKLRAQASNEVTYLSGAVSENWHICQLSHKHSELIARFLVDGNSLATSTYTFNNAYRFSESLLYIGRDPQTETEYFTGKLSYLRIDNKKLSLDELNVEKENVNDNLVRYTELDHPYIPLGDYQRALFDYVEKIPSVITIPPNTECPYKVIPITYGSDPPVIEVDEPFEIIDEGTFVPGGTDYITVSVPNDPPPEMLLTVDEVTTVITVWPCTVSQCLTGLSFITYPETIQERHIYYIEVAGGTTPIFWEVTGPATLVNPSSTLRHAYLSITGPVPPEGITITTYDCYGNLISLTLFEGV